MKLGPRGSSSIRTQRDWLQWLSSLNSRKHSSFRYLSLDLKEEWLLNPELLLQMVDKSSSRKLRVAMLEVHNGHSLEFIMRILSVKQILAIALHLNSTDHGFTPALLTRINFAGHKFVQVFNYTRDIFSAATPIIAWFSRQALSTNLLEVSFIWRIYVTINFKRSASRKPFLCTIKQLKPCKLPFQAINRLSNVESLSYDNNLGSILPQQMKLVPLSSLTNIEFKGVASFKAMLGFSFSYKAKFFIDIKVRLDEVLARMLLLLMKRSKRKLGVNFTGYSHCPKRILVSLISEYFAVLPRYRKQRGRILKALQVTPSPLLLPTPGLPNSLVYEEMKKYKRFEQYALWFLNVRC